MKLTNTEVGDLAHGLAISKLILTFELINLYCNERHLFSLFHQKITLGLLL